MNVLDWILLVLVGMYALSGYWQGFVTGAFATLGLVLGGGLGVWLAPKMLGGATPSVWVSISAVFVMIICASLGQAALQAMGTSIRDSITWQPVRAVDAVGGAVLSSMAVLLVAWALGVALAGSKLGSIAPIVRNSTILGAVNAALPQNAAGVLKSFNEVVAATPFPQYLEPFAPERIVPVEPGPERLTSDPELIAAERAVLKIHGENECGAGVEGTGFLYADDRLMTNAHVVAGVDSPQVLLSDNRVIEAEVVYFNPDLDVAVLAFDDQGRKPLLFGAARAKQPVAVVGYPEDGPFTIEPARVRAEQKMRSPNIYAESSVVRTVLSLRAKVLPGNSGGPILTPDGRVAGVVFAASITDAETGYALTARSVAEAAEKGISGTEAVSTQGCGT